MTSQKRINPIIKATLRWFKLVGSCFIVIHFGIMVLEALLLSLSILIFTSRHGNYHAIYLFILIYSSFGAKYYVHVGSALLYGAHQVTMCRFNNYKIHLGIDPPQCLLFSLGRFLFKNMHSIPNYSSYRIFHLFFITYLKAWNL